MDVVVLRALVGVRDVAGPRPFVAESGRQWSLREAALWEWLLQQRCKANHGTGIFNFVSQGQQKWGMLIRILTDIVSILKNLLVVIMFSGFLHHFL